MLATMDAHLARPRAASSRLAVLSLALLWGLNWPAVRVALGGFGPWGLHALGLSTAALLLMALARARGQSLAVPAGHRGRLLLSGLLNIAGFNLCTTFAQLAGTTTRATIVAYTMPMWAVLFAWLLLGERPDRRRWMALALGTAGLISLALPLLIQGAPGAGVAFSLFAGASWAAGTVVVKRWPVDAQPFAIAAWQLWVGAAVAAGGMLLFEGFPELARIGAVPAAAFVYHAVLAIALGYVIWFDVVAKLPAGTAALGTLMVPVVGVLGAMALLGERPSAGDLTGFVLIVAAAWTALAPKDIKETRP